MVATPSTSSQTKGVVRQVIGPVLDVEFPAGKLPKILNALRIEAKNPAGQEIVENVLLVGIIVLDIIR
ncbi:hypothetical protein N9V09_02860 [Prochlorococcus sp. AH-736-K20]|nr:hypothetical protein [Prochlorococcus sp. AH-736-K20]MDA9746337.1 hypothetical protein [Prochlorococcus sp. AH-736-K20]